MPPCRTAIHASVWGPHWDSVGIAPTIEAAAALGYDHVVVPLRNLEEIDPAKLARTFGSFGLTPLNTTGLPANCDVGSDDPATRQRGIDRLRRALSIARDMGSTQLGGVLYGPLTRAPTLACRRSLDAAAVSLATVAEAAAQMGIRLAIEAVNRYETNLINTAAQAASFVDMVGSANVGIHLDTFHMSIEERDIHAALRTAIPQMFYFELDQSHRGMLREGCLDLKTITKFALRTGYRGVVGVEAFSRSRMASAHADTLAVWRNTYEDANSLAAEAIALIRQCWEDITG